MKNKMDDFSNPTLKNS